MKLWIALALGAALFAQEKGKPLKPGLYATFDTSEGTFQAILYEKDAPVTVKNFVELAQGVKPWLDPLTKKMVQRPLYQNLTFHRVLPEIMIQTGDPTGKGTHNCGVHLPDEFRPGIQFSGSGRLAMANTGEPNSAGCQFFVTSDTMSQWNEKYTIFGQVVSGQKVVDKINRQPVRNEHPVYPAILNNVSIVRISPNSR